MIDLAELQMGPRRFLDARRRELAALRFDRIAVKPLAPSIGGEISGVDLREPLDDATFAEIERALLEYKVVFFRDQDLSMDQQADFARRFGPLEEHPFLPSPDGEPQVIRFEKDEQVVGVENIWHSDVSWREEPSLGGARGADFAYLGPVASFLVGGFECALLFGALVLLAGRLGGAARLVTGVLLLLLLVAGLGAAIEAKGDPAGLRPWVWWLLGDVSRATYWTAAPVALLILGLTAGLVRSIDPGIHFADQTEATRRRLLGRAGLLFGLCLGAVGLVAFFALIVALAARWLLGHEALRSWTFAAAALGALAMIFADALPRALFGGLGPPVGIAIAAVAIPWYLLRNENRSYPWARGFEFLLGLLVGLGLLGAIYVLRQLATFIA